MTRSTAPRQKYRLVHLTCITLFICITLVSAKNIKDEIDSVNALPHHYIVSNAHKCVDIFTENAALARSINYPYGEARAYWRLSLAWHILGKQDERISSLLQAIKRFESMDTSPELAAIYGDYGYAQR
ncbi:MAG: hypothetical protein GF313_07125, partial [Caldithrix sp.]|nr:hypothetical protein [Caldithrix sp.]